MTAPKSRHHGVEASVGEREMLHVGSYGAQIGPDLSHA